MKVESQRWEQSATVVVRLRAQNASYREAETGDYGESSGANPG